MPRTARFVIDNAYYHVITRGNQRQAVFTEEEDFLKYLELLSKYKKKYKFSLFGYCLMPNHVHLMIDPNGCANLAKVMQAINQSYARYFNYKYRKSGHLWQGRFKSMIINKDQYFLDCINYIECNPVRANIAKCPLDYRWSSYKSRSVGTSGSLLDLPKL